MEMVRIKNFVKFGVITSLAAFVLASCGATNDGTPNMNKTEFPVPQYILVNEIMAKPDKRDELIAILTEATRDMPGNYLYDIQIDPENPDRLVIKEIWDGADSHQGSLTLPKVKAALTQGRPLIVSAKNISVGQRLERGTPVK